MIIVPTAVCVLQSLRAIGRDYDAEEDGSISVDGGLCTIQCSAQPGEPIVIGFSEDADPGYAADLTLRLAWFLQLSGNVVVVESGHADVSKVVGFIH